MAHVEGTKIDTNDTQLVSYYERSGYQITGAPAKRPAVRRLPQKRQLAAAKRPPAK